jgi:hypothetical protein
MLVWKPFLSSCVPIPWQAVQLLEFTANKIEMRINHQVVPEELLIFRYLLINNKHKGEIKI